MIKIDHIYSAAFVENYLVFVLSDVQPRIRKMLSHVPAKLSASVTTAFNRANLESMIIGRAESLEKIATQLYDQFPIIAERYCYSYLLQKINFPAYALTLKLSCSAQKKDFELAIRGVVSSLKSLVSTHELRLTPRYISALESGIPSTQKKRYLARLLNAQRGGSQATDADKKLFPRWVNDLYSCFNYGTISEKFGHALVDQLGISICPYCALEHIQAYISIDVRPELDHFYPKSRFPFLAVSLYNLIPAGWICNQRHKRNNPMLGRLNPYLGGFEQGTVFKFGFLPDGDIFQNMSIELIPQGCDLKDQHAELFKIETLYSETQSLRSWFVGIYKAQQWLKETQQLDGFNAHHPLFSSFVDIERPATKVTAQKFKIDAINDLFKQQLENADVSED